ncbi:uncharacterized protein LOC103517502 [Diaphorina citri]|uniref:Uncharacterized protein LOC103517502 n=1 Tax=Diaphorina citri TaxID=121845 RepID=A0A1S4ELC5_DIACI|nr:uncharacterized protein LOC103517502 [Diaphorina citri]
MCNKVTQVKPIMITMGVYCKRLTSTRNIQTGEDIGMPKIIPVPVPIYVPAPMAMYSVPFPVPVPVPVPVPIPVFIPTTRNSIKGIMKEIQNIYEKIPSDPFEAEMLLMAQMAASSADPAPPVDTSDSEAENGNTVSGGCKENVAPVNDLSSMQPLPSEGIVDYSLSHFLPVSDVAVPVQCAEAEVATSNPEPVMDLIDAESSLQLSKIVKSAATPAVQRAAIEDVVPSGPVRKIILVYFLGSLMPKCHHPKENTIASHQKQRDVNHGTQRTWKKQFEMFQRKTQLQVIKNKETSIMELRGHGKSSSRCLIPVPVPIYVPAPMAMYSVPFPVPVPVPVPVPIPVFIPTTRNSIKGIMKEIQVKEIE